VPAPESVAMVGHAVVSRAELPEYLSTDQANAFFDRLREDLASTGLFESVAVGEAPSQEAIVIFAEYSPRLCFAEPLVTVVTLGVIPYPGCYYSGYRLRLRGHRFPHDVIVDSLARPSRFWGWLAGPISLLPGWSWAAPVKQERQRLRASIQNAISGTPRSDA
jgi:hypothetical protein